jgi:hypothetical protein
MIRPIVGTDLRQVAEADLLYVVGTEFRDDNGIYWRRDEDGLCHTINEAGLAWGLPRVLDASTGPVIVTYIPPVTSPHDRHGHYICSGECAYRFYLREDGLWEGPWTSDGRHLRKRQPLMRWHDLDEEFGDCARNLVGPVPAAVIKGL